MKTDHKTTILLVDDDRHLLESMRDWLAEQGFHVLTAADRKSAEEQLASHPVDLAVVDLRLGPDDGFEVLHYCKDHYPHTPVILMTGYATVDTGIEAVRAGAFDLLTKPLIDEELLIAFDRALSQQKVIEENVSLKAQLDDRFGMENIVGNDLRMQKIFDIIDSVADTKATVLITGQSGTGKSLVAPGDSSAQ